MNPSFLLPYPQVSDERKEALVQWTLEVGIRFSSPELLNLSFIHKSWANENGSFHNNERLEFLGDAILGLTISHWLYENLPGEKEGELAKLKSFLVSEEHLSQVAKKFGLGEFLLLGKGEENSGGRNKKALLADATEAFFGAAYLDSGWELSRALILNLLKPAEILRAGNTHDFKTAFQELCQKRHRTYPRYRLLETSGPDHDRVFSVEVEVEGRVYGRGSGKSKKDAEQEAAQKALEILISEDAEEV